MDDAERIEDAIARITDEKRATVPYLREPVGSNELRSEGWRTIRARTCSIQAETSNQYFYGYAEEVTGDGTWGGNFGHCVIRPGPFDFPMRGMCSRPGAAEIRMIELQADDSVYGGRFTWNLNY
jgi:hypothetical protein